MFPRVFTDEKYYKKKRDYSYYPLLSATIYEISISDEVTLSETYTRSAEFHIKVQSDLTLDAYSGRKQQTAEVNINHDLLVSDNAFIKLDVYVISIEDTVIVSDEAHRPATTFTYTIGDTVNVTDLSHLLRNYQVIIQHEVTIFGAAQKYADRQIYDKNNLIEIYTCTHEVTRSLTDLNTITNKLTPHIDTERTITHILEPYDDWIPILLTSNTNHPAVIGATVLYTTIMTLIGSTSAIILPLPELGDPIRANSTVTLKRSMTGTVRSYVKRALTSIIEYEWILSYTKALELKAWYKDNNHSAIEMQNWKGEIWNVKILTDEIQLEQLGKYQGSGYGKTRVSLQFEGTKLIG